MMSYIQILDQIAEKKKNLTGQMNLLILHLKRIDRSTSLDFLMLTSIAKKNY